MRVRNKICMGVISILCLTNLFGCGTKTERKTVADIDKIETESEKQSDSRTTADIPQSRSDINNIMNDEITEARIDRTDRVYSTTDKEILNELVRRIAGLQLREISEEPPTEDIIYGCSYCLYLLSDNHILYKFSGTGNIIAIGDKFYAVESDINSESDWYNVIEYCKRTFCS